MLKVEINKNEINPKTELTFYSSLNPIPFSVTIGDYYSLPNTIYARNLDGKNLIEFRFDQNNQSLYEVALVAIQNNLVIYSLLNHTIPESRDFYTCKIIEGSSILKNTLPMKILKGKDSVCIDIAINEYLDIKYFAIGKNTYIGVNKDLFLVSIFLTDLKQGDIFGIFGF